MATIHNRTNTILLRIVLIVIFGIASCAIVLSFYIQQTLSHTTDARFTQDTRQVTQNILDQIALHNSILYNASAFIVSSDTLTQHAWKTYFSSQKTLDTHKGISSISYAEVVPFAKKQAFENEARAEEALGDNFTIHPAGDRDTYLVARRVIARGDVSGAYGFDNYSTPERRATYRQAELHNSPQASPPITFATGSLGFFVALPVTTEQHTTAGFIIMSFHVADFLTFIPENTPNTVSLRITDETNQQSPIALFEHPKWRKTSADLTRTDRISFAGRAWKIDFKAPRAYQDAVLNFTAPRIILVTAGTLILVIILGYIIYARHHQPKHKTSS